MPKKRCKFAKFLGDTFDFVFVLIFDLTLTPIFTYAPAHVQKALLVLGKAGGAPAAGRRGAPATRNRRPRRPWLSTEKCIVAVICLPNFANYYKRARSRLYE